MKKSLLTLLVISLINFSFSQEIEKLDYCNCIEKIEKNSPVYNGKYERIAMRK